MKNQKVSYKKKRKKKEWNADMVAFIPKHLSWPCMESNREELEVFWQVVYTGGHQQSRKTRKRGQSRLQGLQMTQRVEQKQSDYLLYRY